MLAAWQRIFERRAERSAAKRYATELGARLRRDYSASEFYTPGQIKAAVIACRLPSRYLPFGYAAFLPKAEFRILVPDGDYKSTRASLLRYVRSSVTGTFEPAPANSMAVTAYHHAYDAAFHH